MKGHGPARIVQSPWTTSSPPLKVPFGFILKKQIRRIVVTHAATNLTLKKVKGQGHGILPIEGACHNDHACKISMLYH